MSPGTHFTVRSNYILHMIGSPPANASFQVIGFGATESGGKLSNTLQVGMLLFVVRRR